MTRLSHTKKLTRSWFRPRLEVLEDRVVPATVSWDGGAGTFNWHDALNWDTNELPGAADDVVIDVPAAITVTHSTGTTTVKSLLTAEALTISGGSLTVLNDFVLRNTLSLAGGTLRDTTATSDNGSTMQVTSADGTLDGVTLGVNTTLLQGAQVTVLNGLTLAGGILLRLERPSTGSADNDANDVGLNFGGGAQTLGGSGAVELFRASPGAGTAEEDDVRVRSTSGTLTIGAGITIHNATNSNLTTLGNPSLPLIIEGTVKAQSGGQTLRVNGSTVTNNGVLEGVAGELDLINLKNLGEVRVSTGTVRLRGTWDNDGAILQTGGTVHLDDTFTLENLNLPAFTGSAGTVNLRGTLDDPGATLTLDAPRTWQLSGGTLRGITVAGEAGASFRVTNADGTLDGVTLGVNTTLLQGAQVTVLNGLTLAGGILLRLERPSTGSAEVSLDVGLNFSGSGEQTLGGSGVVELSNAYNFTATEQMVRVRAIGAATLTIGPQVTVQNVAGSRLTTLGDPSRALVIEGTVRAQSSGQTLRVTGSTVTAAGLTVTPEGTFESLLESTAGELDTNNLTNLGQIQVSTGSLRLRGAWDNDGAITQTGGTIHLDGTFRITDLGAFTGTGGTVNISGTLDGTGAEEDDPDRTLKLDTARTWQLNGGTLRSLKVADGDPNRPFQVTSADGTLDGVTLGVNTTLLPGAQVTVTGGLTLDGGVMLRLARTSTGSAEVSLDVGLNFSGNGEQTLGGSGVVELSNAYNFTATEQMVRVRAIGTASLTIGEGVTVQNATGSRLTTLGEGSRPLHINGTVRAQSSSQTLRVTGSSVTTTGTLEVAAGELDVNNLNGDVNAIAITGGDLDLDGNYTFNQLVSVSTGSLTLGGAWHNGSIITQTGGTITAGGNWANDGTITQAGGTIHLGGTFTVADLGTFTGTAGTVNIFGTLDDPGATLTIDALRTWQLSGGTLKGVRIDGGGDPSKPFQVTSTNGVTSPNGPFFNGVTLAWNTTLRQGAQVTVLNGLTLAEGVTLRLERTTSSSNSDTIDVGLNFSGSQTLGGTGVVELYSALNNAQIGIGNFSEPDDVRVWATSGTLTIDSGITVQNASPSSLNNQVTLGNPALPLALRGTVLAQRPSQTFTVTGSSVSNTGTLMTTAGILDVNNLTGDVNDTWLSGSGILDLDGVYTFNKPVSVPSGTLTLRGNWANASTITQTGGTIRLGGTFTVADLGTFTGTGGTVSIFGTLDDPGATLTINKARTWQLTEAGTLRGVTIEGENGSLFQVTNLDGTFDAVKLGVNTTLREGAQVTVLNGLTLLGGVKLLLERTTSSSNSDTIDVGLNFSGSQTLGGTGVVELYSALNNAQIGSGNFSEPDDVRVWATSGTLTIDSGITVQNASPSSLNNQVTLGNPALPLVLRGTVLAQRPSQTFTVTGSSVSNQGILQTLNNGILQINPSLAVDGSGILSGPGSGAINLIGNLIGDASNRDLYNPLGIVRLNGAGTVAAPQLLEVMGRDLGSAAAGFSKNFVYGNLTLGNNTYVQLVDLADNAPGTEAEALYATSLVVPGSATLDLNGLNLYVRAMQIGGTVTGGTITWVPDGDTLAFATPTPGAIAVVGEVDQWQFFGRGGRDATIVVNPGSTGQAPLTPRLNFALVQLLDSEGNILASGSSATSGAVVTLRDVRLPDDGTYTVSIRATTSQPNSTGNYLATLWDSTTDVSALTLGQRHIGSIETPFSQDRWVFSAAAGQQVRFDLLSNAVPGTTFTLTGPADFTGFTNLTDDSGLVNLTQSGTYTLIAAAGASGLLGAYTFQLMETSVVELTLGMPYEGQFVGHGQAQLFRANVPQGKPLQVILDDSSSANSNEVYVRFGAPPTRADYQFRFATPGADQQVVVPQAAPGTWYILVYSPSVAVSGPFTITAQTGDIVLASVTPDHHGNGVETVLTLTGAGFLGPVTVELVGEDGTAFPAASVRVDRPTQLTATFAAGAVPVGLYTVRASLANRASSELPDAFRMEDTAEAVLWTDLVTPNVVGRNALATVYVEYANTGTAAMPAPILVVSASDQALLTLDASRIVTGLWTSSVPEGFGHTVQIRGSGATPGVLQPGERMRVPVYYVGLQAPWDLADFSVNFRLEIVRHDNSTPIDWAAVKEQRPPSISPEAWDVIHANLQDQVGDTWGDYVRTLSDNAAYLARLGQRVVDDGELWSFEVQQASGLSPVSSLAAVTDLYVEAPGLPITFGRVYSSGIADRFELGILGRGWAWAGGWVRLLTVEADGSVIISDQCGCGSNASRGSQRLFQPDSRKAGVYFSQAGDNATLTRLSGGLYELREANGLVTRFRSDGRVDYVADLNSNRITTTWTDGRLTRLTHSAGQFLQIGYNSAGRITDLLDSTGRSVVFGYDPTSEHLLSATRSEGRTTHYTYSTGAGTAQEHALLSVQYPDATREVFTYDGQGRLESVALAGGTQPITFAYDSVGGVTATDAVGGTGSYYFDHWGRLAAFEDALGRRTILGFNGLNLTQVTDALGQNYTFAHDSRGNVISSTDPLGQTTTFTYTTNFNRLASVTDARGNPLKYGYDNRGNLISITYADNSVERFTVDAVGNLDTYTNRRGQLVDASYDTSGRLLRQDFPDGSFVEYRYNSRGNLDQAISPEGTTQVEYLDGLHPDLPTKITYPNGRFLAYTYEDGRRTSLVHPDGFTVNYLYDGLGRLEFLRDGDDNLIVQYHYDAAGRLKRKSNGNGTFTEYEYDLAGQILHLINHAPDGAVNSRFDYVYDALGRRTRMTTLEGVWDYSYDGIGQLTRAVFTSNDPAAIPDQDLTYVYDAVGNRVRTIINGVTTEYTTNNLNQYVQVGTAQYSYDRDGNLVARVDGSVTESFTYDAVNRLVGVSTLDGTWDYEYDAFGSRSTTVRNGLRTEYLVDPFGLGDVVAEYADGLTLGTRYVHAFSNLVNRLDGGGAAYYEFDALGSTVALTGASGQTLNRYSYLPFGEVLIGTASVPTPFTFIGQFGVMEESHGLYFMRHRYYGSEVGVFTSIDPLRILPNSLYMYVENDPVQLIDPLGLEPAFSQFLGCIQARNEAGLGDFESPGAERRFNQFRRASQGVGNTAPQAAIEIGGDFGGLSKSPGKNLKKALKLRQLGPGNCPGGPDVDPPDSDSGDLTHSRDVSIPRPSDPNEKTGPAGFGPVAFIAAGTLLPYRIDFENEAAATAPAQRVVVTDQLDSNLNWSTFEFTEVGFGDYHLVILAGSQFFATTLPVIVNDREFDVEIELTLELQTGLVTAVFQSIDPAIGLPPDVLTGFLPPEDGTGRGQGFFSYTLQPRASLPTGTQLKNIAVINFVGSGEIIATNQVDPHDPSQGTDPAREARNTIDAGAPDSTVEPLPANTSVPNFLVNWSGADDNGGSGIGFFDVFVSIDGGAFALWQERTTQTSATYNGQPGRTYAFYSIATDNVGHRQPTPAATQATVTIDIIPPTSTMASLNAFSAASFALNWSGTDGYGLGVASYDVYVSDNGGPFTPWLTETTETSATFTGVSGHTYGFYSVATDNFGIRQPASTSAQTTTTVDATAPSSTVTALPTFRLPTFTLTWSGADNANGSGVASYSVYVSDNGGSFTPLITATTETSTPFTGVDGHTYGFYVVAVDHLGNEQPTPADAQTTTTVDAMSPTSAVAVLPAFSTGNFQVSWSGSDGNGSGIASYDVYVSDNGGSFTALLLTTTATSTTFTGVDGHTYGFYAVAVDHVGNQQATPASAQATTSVDATPPVSSVAVLPAFSTDNFLVTWSGSDGSGSGIASYDVYVSDNGGPFTPWLTDSTQTSGAFMGVNGHTYGFYSVALDNAGGREPAPTSAQTSTTVDTAAPSSTVAALPTFHSSTFTLIWSGTDNPGGSGLATYDVYVSDNGGDFTPLLLATTTTSTTFTGVDGHTYGFYSVAVDHVGNQQVTPAGVQATTTIDAIPPTSSVAALPAFSTGNFQVSWSGSDGSGSGIASYDVYVSDNGSSFTPLLLATTTTSTTFTGVDGHTYGFYSIALDNAGNYEPAPTTAQTTTTVDTAPPSSTVDALPTFRPSTFTLTWSGVDNPGGSGLATYDVYVSDNGGSFTSLLLATTATSTTFTGVDGHTYGFYSVAVDHLGNQEATPAGTQASTTVDATPPTSSVATLPAFSPGNFLVSWSGSDETGSGIAAYDIHVSDNGGPFTLWLIETTQTSATFTGVNGHTYGFYSVALDNSGAREPAATSAQASTTVDTTSPSSTVAALPAFQSSTFMLTWSGTDNLGGSGLATYDVYVSDNGGDFTPLLLATTATSTTFTGVDGHTYGFYTVAVDHLGNEQATPAVAQTTTTVDGTSPTSAVASLPAFSVSNISVTWAGSDGSGSGIASYDVYVSDNGGPFTPWLLGASETAATYSGVSGHTYAFHSVVRDNAGNVQPTPPAGQATTTVDDLPPTSSVATLPPTSPGTFLVQWSGSDNSGGSGLVSYSVFVSDNGGAFTSLLTATTQTSTSFTGANDHTYAFYSIAVDGLGNVQPTPLAAQATSTVRQPQPPPPPPPPPAKPSHPVSVALALAAKGKKNRKLKKRYLRVTMSDGSVREILSPYQSPTASSIAAVLTQGGPDSTPDSILVTAKKGNKRISTLLRI